jgi:hypothetical protein
MSNTERSRLYRAKLRAEQGIEPRPPGRPPRDATKQTKPATKSEAPDLAPLTARIRELEAELARERATKPAAAAAADAASLPKSYRERFEAMCRRQEREYEARVQQGTDARARKFIDEIFLPHLRKRLEDAERECESIRRIFDRRTPIIPKALFLKLWAYANPGTRDQVSEADHRRLWDALNANKGNRKLVEIALCGREADRPSGQPPPTWADLMAAREKVRAENSARAKRAAATRAANQGKK